MKDALLVLLTLVIVNILPRPKQLENDPNVGKVGDTVSVDGIRYKTIQECVEAAAQSASRTCDVPAGTANNSQIEMASGVRLIFAGGRFVNTGSHSGVFIHFSRSIRNATVCGSGSSSTYLLNASTGSQFGAVIQDEGTHDTICDLTANGNGNTTSTLVHQRAIRPEVQNVKLIADLTHVDNHSYAWDIRGGSDFEVSNLEAQGGSLDAIQLTTKDFNQSYGNVEGGHFNSIYAHDSPRNGLDFDANGNNLEVRGTVWTNVRLAKNGTANDGTDDEYGLALFAPTTESTITENTFVNVVTTENRGSGILLKGNVVSNTLLGIDSQNNGSGKSGTVGQDSIELISGAGTTAPSNNWLEAYSRSSGKTKPISTDANTRGNSFLFNVGTGSMSFGNRNDDYRFLAPTPKNN